MEVNNVINSEVDKLNLNNTNDLHIEELNLDMDDLSNLEEVYYDNGSDNNQNIKISINEDKKEKINVNNSDLTKENTSDVTRDKSDVISKNILPNSPAVKTIIIDTKKNTKTINDDNNLEINDFNESDEEESNIKQKVYKKYKHSREKNRNYSFFE